MGMDVYGKAPTSEEGKYFRANVWYWKPLADFIIELYPGFAAGCQYWHSNDGDGLDADTSIALADAIEADVASGIVDAYVKTRAERIDAMPSEECSLCQGTGVRTDDLAVERGWDKPFDPVTRTGGCNACAGTGKVRPRISNYPLDADVIREFVPFLRACGGFEIW